MYLWLLKRLEREGYEEVGYDEARGFVVRALDEGHARLLASSRHGCEGVTSWLDPERSSCRRIEVHGDAEVILRDFLSA